MIPIPASVPAIVLFGGSFDPPHTAHVRAAAAARDIAAPEAWLVFVPARRSPHKPTDPGASDEDRLLMLRLAIEGVPRAAVWDAEIARPGASYTIDTVLQARAEAPSAALFLLIGADQAEAFHRWREPRAILSQARVIVMPRAGVGSGPALRARLALAGFWSPAELDSWERAIVASPAINTSSTRVREAIRAGAPADIDPRVRDYIDHRGLYRGVKGS